jgi:aerobic carbon-monoxide dehydrogenase medium subunit
MYMPDVEYHAPKTLAEACVLLDELGETAKVLGGGSDILHKMKNGHLHPEHLVSLKHMTELHDVRYEKGRGIIIGALVTPGETYRSEVIQKHYMSINMTAHEMGNPQVRNRGTVGGNICNASPLADLPPILIALNASVKVVEYAGERIVPLEDFISGPGKTIIRRDEILKEVIIPDQETTGSTYMKFGLRKSGALAVVGVAVAVTVKDGVLLDARIVMGAVAPVPMRAKKAEALLKGQPITDELLAQAAESASNECTPISDIRGSAEYRRELVKVLTRRSLRKAIDEGHV